jgi:hypothetical protein
MSSQAHISHAPTQAPWLTTVVHAIVGLLLFALLLAGAVAYGVFVLLPELLRDQVELIFERYNTLLPDLMNPTVPPWLWVWSGGALLGAVAVSVGFWVLIRVRQLPWIWAWAWAGAVALLLVPPVLIGFLLPSVPKFPGGVIWWYITAVGLTAGFFYVAWMYYRDSHGVGPLWASLLGLLRATVFTLLAFFFMLPAVREYKDSFIRSKVLVVFDVSGSLVYTIDDVPTNAVPLDKLPTRQDKILAFLDDQKVSFLKRLQEKNPVDVFRIARGLDPENLHFSVIDAEDREHRTWSWTRADFDAWLKNPNRAKEMPPPGDLPPELWKLWLKPSVPPGEAPPEWSADEQARFQKFIALNDALYQKDSEYTSATNIGDSLLSLLDNESKKMLRGVVVFSDGRSNEGSPNAFEQLKEHAQASNIPIFMVGVGEERPKVKIEIADLRVPQQVQPDDKFPAMAELTGEGLPDKPVDVELEVTYVKKGRDGKEELLPIGLIESVELKPGDKAPAPGQLQTVSLGSKIVLHPAEPPRFDKGSPPRVEVPFQIDAATLAAAAGVDLKAPPLNAVKKWEIVETVPDAELRFRVRTPRDPQEIFANKDHVSDPAGMIVQRKPLRVLLFASAATHEYQFVQAIMVRDMAKGRVKVNAYLQPPPGRTELREGVLQDATLLKKFPDQIDRKFATEEDKQYDLSEYDAIIAFDPDWMQLKEEEIKLVKQWADNGGGLVYVAGPVNTLQLARPSGATLDRLKPILDLLPVTLQDIRLAEGDRKTDLAWPLDLSGAAPDMEFLKLAEESDTEKGPKFLDDWKEFFGPVQPDGSVNRGFYNFYPVEKVKPLAVVAARFADPTAKLKDQTLMPFIVLSNPNDPDHRIVWIGWGEMWRLRQKNEAYLERFWTKLSRFAGGNNQGRVVKRITPNFGRIFTVGQNVSMEARIDDKGGVRLNENARPKVVITAPLAGPKTTELQKRELEDLAKEKWMTYKPKSDGWFAVRFKPPIEGDYTMQVTVNETGDTVTHKFTVKPSNPELDDARPDFARMYDIASYADEEVQPRMSGPDYAELLQKLRRPKLDENEQKEDRPKLFFNLKNADLIPKCMDKLSDQRREYSDPRPIWDVMVKMLTPVRERYLPAWAAWGLAACLGAGCAIGFFFFRSERRGLPLGLQAALALLGLVSVPGYYLGRHLGIGGWAICIALATLVVAPLYLPAEVALGWYALAALVGLLSTEWLVRKLLRLA